MEPRMHQAPTWDERYDADDYVFGTEPAAFLVAQRRFLRAGDATLVVADGEGRNSVYLAECGLEVTAMDVSPVGVAKANALASARGVEVDHRVGDVLTWDWQPASYDCVVAIFIQFLDPDRRAVMFRDMARSLRPGGRLLLHGYRPEQVDYATGGPPFREYMYTESLLRKSFPDLVVERLESYDAVLDEGAGHRGPSALIDFVARVPDTGRGE